MQTNAGLKMQLPCRAGRKIKEAAGKTASSNPKGRYFRIALRGFLGRRDIQAKVHGKEENALISTELLNDNSVGVSAGCVRAAFNS